MLKRVEALQRERRWARRKVDEIDRRIRALTVEALGSELESVTLEKKRRANVRLARRRVAERSRVWDVEMECEEELDVDGFIAEMEELAREVGQGSRVVG